MTLPADRRRRARLALVTVLAACVMLTAGCSFLRAGDARLQNVAGPIPNHVITNPEEASGEHDHSCGPTGAGTPTRPCIRDPASGRWEPGTLDGSSGCLAAGWAVDAGAGPVDGCGRSAGRGHQGDRFPRRHGARGDVALRALGRPQWANGRPLSDSFGLVLLALGTGRRRHRATMCIGSARTDGPSRWDRRRVRVPWVTILTTASAVASRR